MYLPAPAKVNLFLHITGRRSNGYHDLQTWFQLLDYGDELAFIPRHDGEIHTRIEYTDDDFTTTIESKDNLVTRAAAVMRKHCSDKSVGVDIILRKKIPVGAGLGGGSSDAATTLHALNQLWKCRLQKVELLELSKELGADVPIFVHGESAWAEGIGDHLKSAPLPEVWYLILVPSVRVSSAKMFQLPELVRDCSPITMVEYHAGQTDNVFTAVVRKYYPPVAEVLDWLSQYGDARLTGSGSGVFAAFANFAEAEAVLQEKPSRLFGIIARGLNHSPLANAISKAFLK